MTLTADLQSVADVDPRAIADEIGGGPSGGRVQSIRGVVGRMGGMARGGGRGSVLPTVLGMSAACLGSVLVASAVHRGSPWAGLNALSSGIGLVGRRPPSRFVPRLAAIGVGTILGGSLVVGSIVSKLGVGRVGSGVLASVASYGMDRLLMRRTLFPALTSSLGPVGTVLKYAAIGIGAMLGRR
jgi:hypothetical protein